MKQQTIDFRKRVADEFVKALQEKEYSWRKGWKAFGCKPQNAVSGYMYRGINRLHLSMLCSMEGITDCRFATFKQIKDQGWHLKKGSKGVSVEYWMPFDKNQKKILSWEEYRKYSLAEKQNIVLLPKYFTVFRARDIEGIPELPKPEVHDINTDQTVETICKNMNIEIKNDGGDRAFYRPSEDKIHLPLKEYFESDYDYNSVAMHELSHATGAAHRLNRNINNLFASDSYAYEELVAEVSSAFMSEHLSSICNGYQMENHKAYIQSWCRELQNNPDILMKAVKDAERASDYLEYKAELLTEQEYKKRNALCMDTDAQEDALSNEPIVDERSFEEIRKDVKKSKFVATDKMVKNIQKLDRITGRENSLKDISKAYKNGCDGVGKEEKALIEAIAKECKAQQLARIPVR